MQIIRFYSNTYIIVQFKDWLTNSPPRSIFVNLAIANRVLLINLASLSPSPSMLAYSKISLVQHVISMRSLHSPNIYKEFSAPH